ncbi:MAG TPA: ABC transporter permease [Candidatus Stackebrandtia excrementipullorum]|nr:ABC transporter permease [Candidatus Stackebrandtia excrementipullorum]
MIGFVLRRTLRGVVVVFAVATAIFVLVRLTGDPASVYLPLDATQEQIETLRAELGLNLPWWEQYFRYIANIATGDLGRSLIYAEPALDTVLSRLPATFQLTVAGLGLSLVIGVPLGVLSALRHGRPTDSTVVSTAVVLQNMPSFWLGIVLIAVFAVSLGWFPPAGGKGLVSLVLPAVTLGAYSIAAIIRLTRSSMLEVLSQSYIRTADAKGAGTRRRVGIHALPNALLPVLSFAGMQFGVLLGGSVVVEAVFAYPGMGSLVIQAVNARDFALIQTFAVVVAALIVFINVVVDLLSAVVDPQLRSRLT